MAAPTERIARATVSPSAAAGVLLAAAPFPTTGEDRLRVNVVNVAAGLTVGVSGRYVIPGDTHVRVLQDSFIPTSDGSEATHTIPIGEAALYNLVVRSLGAIVAPGQCFVRLEVVRGDGAANVVGVLLAGYMGSWGGIAWPGTPLRDPGDGSGFINLLQSDLPAPGANPFLFMPAQTRWRIQAVRAVLTTALGGGTRSVYLRLLQYGQVVWQAPSSLPQAPGTVAGHSWAAGVAATPDPSSLLGVGSLPTALVLETLGSHFVVVDLVVNGLQAGDQWDLMWTDVEEWRHPALTTF